jgi:hypothetical protein
LLYKKESPRFTKNYRGLTLTNHIAKEVERMIYRRLLRLCALSACIRNDEFAFTSGRSTVDAIFINTLLTSWARERKQPLYKCYIDLHKAFDRVHRPTLWEMVRRLGLPPKILNFMMNMYDRVQLSLRCLGELSEFFPMLNGLIQGGVLPPLLFNIFVAVIINAAHTQFQALGLDAGIRLLCRTTGNYLDLSSGTGPTHVLNLVQLLYCDDWILISHDPKTLEAMINIIDRMVRAFGQMHACPG